MPGPITRARQFAERLGARVPVFLAPMAGACPPSLSIAVANAGGVGACGALMMKPDEIRTWMAEFRAGSQGALQINLWIPDPPPQRDAQSEKEQRDFLAHWGPEVPPDAGDTRLPDFDAQCEALLSANPTAISSIMGLYPTDFVEKMKTRGILWFATATTVTEARAAEEAGADAIVAQGMEAGGHRGAFAARSAERQMVGLVSLIPQIVDAVRVPVIATGGIADARGIVAALLLGASAVQIGTGFLRTPEAQTHPAYADRLARTEAHETTITRAFSGRPGRSIATRYVLASLAGPEPAPYPIQRGLTSRLREAGRQVGDPERMQIWAGQSAKLARPEPAGDMVERLWTSAQDLLRSAGSADA